MRQNITIATIKALNREAGFCFFENAKKLMRMTPSRTGYMSKDGKHAWFWCYSPRTGKYKLYIMSMDTYAVYPAKGGVAAEGDHEASINCRIRCEAYNRDREMNNPSTYETPKEVPKFNHKDYVHHE